MYLHELHILSEISFIFLPNTSLANEPKQLQAEDEGIVARIMEVGEQITLMPTDYVHR